MTKTLYEVTQEFLKLIGGVETHYPKDGGPQSIMVTENVKWQTEVVGLGFVDCFRKTVWLWSEDRPYVAKFMSRNSHWFWGVRE